jgi:hypothetical protein
VAKCAGENCRNSVQGLPYVPPEFSAFIVLARRLQSPVAMKTQTLPANSNIHSQLTKTNRHTDTVEELRRALAALLAGRPDEARALIEARSRKDSTIRPVAHPVSLEEASPEFVQAAAEASTAWELYQEAWKRRQELLGAFLARYGATAVSLGGETFHVIKRERNGATAIFLRRAKG